MKSMKLSKSEQKEMSVPVQVNKDEYPYGLRITLGKDQLKKLGLSKLPAVGDEFIADAKLVVKSVSAGAAESGEYASCDLQITDLGLEEDEAAKTNDTAKKMFTKMGAK